MSNNLDRLKSTARYLNKLWQDERGSQEKNAVHEGAWSLQVIEPLLAALEWSRLRCGDRCSTGAYFEWPKKNNVDVALLHDGRPKAYIELKPSLAQCRKDLKSKLNRHPELNAAHFGVASWFLGEAGFCLDEIGPASTLTLGPVLTLAAACDDPSLLAKLAAPVLTARVADADAWLKTAAADVEPLKPRFSLRGVQQAFFMMLARKLAINEPLKPRLRCLDPAPPTPTYAFVELPGIFPAGWGLVFDIDPTINRLQCLFYRNNNEYVCKTKELSFDAEGEPRSGTLDFLIEDQVLPIVNQWRSEAARP